MTEIKKYTTPKARPLRSISLKPIDQKMPSHHFDCGCEMCGRFEFARNQKQLQNNAEHIADRIHDRIDSRLNKRTKKMNEYQQWLLKHLLVPHNKICRRGICLTIPETVYYKDGEASELYLNKQIQDTTIKRLTKDKLTNTAIQKILGQRRKKFREHIKEKQGLKKIEKQKKNLFGKKQVKKQIKDAVIIRFNDGYEQLATENQLLGILQKRKQDPLWKKILCIKNFISIQNYSKSVFNKKYIRGQEEYQNLFTRAKNLMKNYGQNVGKGDSDYISDLDELKFEKQLLLEGKSIFAEYTLYKIISFIEYFYDCEIQKLTVSFLFTDIDDLILNGVSRLEVKELIKYAWTDNIYKKMVDEEEKRFFYTQEIELNEEIQKNSQLIQTEMMENYDKVKQKVGLTAEVQDDREEVANNQFFKKMHPQFNSNISEVLKNPDLTLQTFKRKYLGYRKERSPIMKTFNCTMIKAIHDLSPQWKRATPHTYMTEIKNRKTINVNPQKINRTANTLVKRKQFSISRRFYSTLNVT